MRVAIQDLTVLDNGLLLSCAYDGKIICWRYSDDVIHGQVVKENQQLRCMGAVTGSGTLLIGTNTFTILTHSITDWVNFYKDDDLKRIGYGGEEYKFEEGDSDDMEGARNMYDDPNYDVLEGQSLEDAMNEIYMRENMSLAEI